MPAGYAKDAAPRETWTDDREKRLRYLIGESYSASQIAADLGGITRNAVIGKAHRLGLSLSKKHRDREICPYQRRTKEAARRPKGVVVERGEVEEKNKPAEGAADRATRERQVLVRRAKIACEGLPDFPPEIGARACDIRGVRFSEENGKPPNCHWIVGDPKGEYRFCGADAAVRPEHDRKRGDYQPWCPYHSKMAYRGPKAAADYLAELQAKAAKTEKVSSLAIAS